jgi:hypothetical protein
VLAAAGGVLAALAAGAFEPVGAAVVAAVPAVGDEAAFFFRAACSS